MAFFSIETVDFLVVVCAGKNATHLFERQRLKRYLEEFNNSSRIVPHGLGTQAIEDSGQDVDQSTKSTGIWEDDAPEHMRQRRRGEDPNQGITFRRRQKKRHTEEITPSLRANAGNVEAFGTLESFRVTSTPRRYLNNQLALTQASSFTIPPTYSWAHKTCFPALALPIPITINRSGPSTFRSPTNPSLSQDPQGDVHQSLSQKFEPAQTKKTGSEEDERRRSCPEAGASKSSWELEDHISLEPGLTWMALLNKQYHIPKKAKLMLPPFIGPLHDHLVGLKIRRHRAWRIHPVDFLMPDPISESQEDLHKMIEGEAEGTDGRTLPDLKPSHRRKVKFVDPCKKQVSRRQKHNNRTWEVSATCYDETSKKTAVLKPGDPLPFKVMQRAAESIVRRIPGRRYTVGTVLHPGAVKRLEKKYIAQARHAAKKSSALGCEYEEYDPYQVPIVENKCEDDLRWDPSSGYESEEWDPGQCPVPDVASEERGVDQDMAPQSAPDHISASDTESVEWDPKWMVEGACG